MKASCSVQRRRHDSRRHVSLRHVDTCPMTSSRSQLTWCDKVADSSSFCRSSFWTPLDRRQHVSTSTAIPEVNSTPSLFATPISGGFMASSTPHLPTPTYDFVFDVDMTRRHRQNFRSPCCPASCHVTEQLVDGARSTSSEEIVGLSAHTHRYVVDTDQPTEVGRTNSR